MDTGNYNCRDYYVSPHFAPTTLAKTIYNRSPLFRHESWDELEQRSRSPVKTPFPLLRLPLELRQQIFAYLLPRTIERSDPNPLASHARNFSAVKKRGARGMLIPASDPAASKGTTHVVWKRGNINLLSVCKQIHDECAELVYGSNTFLLFVTYSDITFRFHWLLDSGLAPTRQYKFLALLPCKYMVLIKRVVANVDHVDSYTGMIKYNVSGKGLTHGLRKQVQRLVNALQPPSTLDDVIGGEQECGHRRLAKVRIRVSNGNAFLDQVKSDVVRQREGAIRVNEDLEEMLEPFGDLWGVREVAISGAVNADTARRLEATMMNVETPPFKTVVAKRFNDLELEPSPPLCVYGNDL